MHSLIVENDLVSSTLLKSIMKKYGTTDVLMERTAVLPAFGKAHRDRKPYDVICLDIMLPGIDSQEILKRLRVWENGQGISGLDSVKTIMMTALDDNRNIMEAFRCQYEGYIVKPVN